jgi:hypothetical protein
MRQTRPGPCVLAVLGAPPQPRLCVCVMCVVCLCVCARVLCVAARTPHRGRTHPALDPFRAHPSSSALASSLTPSSPHSSLARRADAGADQDRPDRPASRGGSVSFLPSMFSFRKKGSVADAEEEEKEIRPEVREDVDASEHGQSPLQAESPLPGAVGQGPARRPAEYDATRAMPPMQQDDTGEAPRDEFRGLSFQQRAARVKEKAKLVNSAWEDSESSDEFDEEGTFDRVVQLRKIDAANMKPEEKRAKALTVVKFERRKRQIADRFQTRRALAEFEQEEGPNIGGQWIDQKWVPNNVLNVKRDQFTISKWMKDLSTYLILLFAFTYIIFTGSGNAEFVSYQRAWRKLLNPRSQQITTPESALVAIEQLVLEDLVDKERPYAPGYLPPGGEGVGVLLASILVGKIRMRQLRVNGIECSRVHAMLTSYGMVASKECYPPFNLKNEEISYTKEGRSKEAEYDNAEEYPYFQYLSPLQTNLPDTVGSYGRYHAGGYIVTFDFEDAKTTLATLRNMQW